ncbi:MAG TPA: hypothetical protein VI685_14010, partial [Candidatus Angelobacter sp.]
MKPDCKYLFGLAYCLAVLTSVCLAGDKEISALMVHASQLSDIWDNNAPAFHLKAALTFYDEKGTTQGTYTESWVSGGQWRRETVIGAFHRIEVARENKRWLLDSNEDMPITANLPQLRLAPWRMDLTLWKSGKLEEKSWHGQALRCVVTGVYPGANAFCVDKVTGALAAEVESVKDEERSVNEICEYSDYQRFGEKMFPHLVRCLDDNKLKLEIRVAELETANNLSAELFAPLDGAKESFNCRGIIQVPKPISSPDPSLPSLVNP